MLGPESSRGSRSNRPSDHAAKPHPGHPTGPSPRALGTKRRGSVWGRRRYCATQVGRASRSPIVSRAHRGLRAGDSHRVVLRALWHSLQLWSAPQTGQAESPADVVARLQELCPERRDVADRRHARGADGRRAPGRDPPARRLPRHVQFLHELPPVHLRELLEHRGRPLPLVRAPARSPGPPRPRRWRTRPLDAARAGCCRPPTTTN